MPRDKYHNNPNAGMCHQCEDFESRENCENCFRHFALFDNFKEKLRRLKGDGE